MYSSNYFHIYLTCNFDSTIQNRTEPEIPQTKLIFNPSRPNRIIATLLSPLSLFPHRFHYAASLITFPPSTLSTTSCMYRTNSSHFFHTIRVTIIGNDHSVTEHGGTRILYATPLARHIYLSKK